MPSFRVLVAERPTDVLVALTKHGPITVHDLGRRLDVDILGELHLLAEMGMAEPTLIPSSEGVVWQITPCGLDWVARAAITKAEKLRDDRDRYALVFAQIDKQLSVLQGASKTRKLKAISAAMADLQPGQDTGPASSRREDLLVKLQTGCEPGGTVSFYRDHGCWLVRVEGQTIRSGSGGSLAAALAAALADGAETEGGHDAR